MSQTTTPVRQLVIIDSQVNNWQSLVGNVGADTTVLILDSSSDGLTQISDYLTTLSANAGAQGFEPLQSLHIISHGSTGSLLLGSSTLNTDNLNQYASQLAIIGKALSHNGELLVYGCNVAQGETGVQFINRLAQYTGVAVAASDDLTGNAKQGGDWVLEASTGIIATPVFSALEYADTLSVNSTNNTQSYPGHSLGEFRNQLAFAVIKADGSVVTWGGSSYGGSSRAVAAQLDGSIDVKQIFSTSGAFAALRSDGSVVTWGDSDFGGDSSAVAAQLGGSTDVTQIFSTNDSFAALRSDGSVVTWGDSDFGGDSSAVTAQLGGSTDVTKIFSTNYSFAALRSDGSVVTWGDPYYGDSSAVAAQLGGSTDVTQIFSTTRAFAALRSDGSVITWGSSGDGGYSDYRQLDGSIDVTQIFSTSSAFAALRSDGSVVTWGSDYYGSDSSVVAAQLDGSTDVTQIFSTTRAFAALRSDGSVVTWGDSFYGGDSSAVAAQLGGSTDVTKIFSTDFSFAALRSDGSVVTWGGGYGDSSAVAAQLDGSNDVTQVFSTDYAFAALRSDGSVVTWGYSSYGGNSSAVSSQLTSGVVSGASVLTNDVFTSTPEVINTHAGDDLYVVDDALDQVIEKFNEGTDTVQSSLPTYTLPANVENLILTGTGNLQGSGNDLANIITGNDAANSLVGYAGNDSLNGGLGDDNLSGDDGIDTAIYSGSLTDYRLYSDSIILNDGSVLNFGGAYLTIVDANLADGNDGVDTLIGIETVQFKDDVIDPFEFFYAGDDRYIIDDVLDQVIEKSNKGTDTVISSLPTYTLPANVENLILAGTDNLEGLGNDLANVITGNAAANSLAGYAGNDSLNGGLGNDSLSGGDGIDTAIYSGSLTGYKFENSNSILTITDTNLADGNDGVDTLTGIETVQFSDQLTGVENLPLSDNTLTSAKILFHNYGNAEQYGEYHGYYKFFFDLSFNSYVHTGLAPGLDGPISADLTALSTFQNNAAKAGGFTLLSADELGLPDVTPLNATSSALTALGHDTDQYHYLFKDGFYDAYIDTTDADLKVDVSSVALVGKTDDALFITFRGSDVLGDWMDDFFAMKEHYARYEPLLTAIDHYIVTNDIKKVYVSGHSLGGQMASMYLADPAYQKTSVEYNAVTFEAANKHVQVNGLLTDDQDTRFINFEMYADPVPDLWFDNYGKTIHISNGDIDLTPLLAASTHGLVGMKNAFDLAITQVSDALPSSDNTRVYVDINSDGKISTDRSTPLLAPSLTAAVGGVTTATGLFLTGKPELTIIAATLANLAGASPDVSLATAFAGVELTAAGLGTMAVSALSTLANEIEYLWTGYDVKTASDKVNSTLTVNPLYFYFGNQKTVHIDNSNLGFVDINNTLPYTGFLAPSIDIDATNWDKKYSYTLRLSGNGASNTITGSAFSDVIRGEAGNDVIYGGDGNDVIDRPVNAILSEWASGGNDNLYGGKGNDTYFVNSNTDVVVELANEGTYDAVVIAGNRGLSKYFNSKNYSVPQNVEIAIARDDKSLNPSENFNITANDSNNHYLIGNAGNNKIIGGSGSDVLVGGGDSDLLVGGNGNDILFGGVYAYGKASLGSLPTEVSTLVAQQANKRPLDSVDVGYYMGGLGADTMIGEHSEAFYKTTEKDLLTDNDGDNDYFFIDVNPANNANNVDTIKNFYVAGTDSLADDWLVFSAAELGLSSSEYSDFNREQIPFYFNDIPVIANTPIWKTGATANDLNGYRLPMENQVFSDYEERLFKVNSITDYTTHLQTAGFLDNYLDDMDLTLTPSDFGDFKFAFVLDTSKGDLYFDRDGNTDYNDTVKVATIGIHPNGDNLADFHANQIIILPNFDFV